ERGIEVDAAIAQKRPVLSRLVNLVEITVNYEHLFLVRRSARDNATERICNKGLAPEIECIFTPDAVYYGNIYTIGDCMSSLNGFPGRVLGQVHFLFLIWQPAN